MIAYFSLRWKQGINNPVTNGQKTGKTCHKRCWMANEHLKKQVSIVTHGETHMLQKYIMIKQLWTIG
jgi:hypothetical protein